MYKYTYRSELTAEVAHFEGVDKLNAAQTAKLYTKERDDIREFLQELYEDYTQEFWDINKEYAGSANVACVKCGSYYAQEDAVYVFTQVIVDEKLDAAALAELNDAVAEFVRYGYNERLSLNCALKERYKRTVQRFSADTLQMETIAVDAQVNTYLWITPPELCSEAEAEEQYKELLTLRTCGVTTVLAFYDITNFRAYVARYGSRKFQECAASAGTEAEAYYVKAWKTSDTAEPTLCMWAVANKHDGSIVYDIYNEESWEGQATTAHGLITAML